MEKQKNYIWRVYFGKADYLSTQIKAPTAEDALTIANLHFKQTGHKAIKIEFEQELNSF